MNRKVIQGIPYWVDTQNRIYAYDPADTTNFLWLGSCSVTFETVELRADLESAYSEKLAKFRSSHQPRDRKPPATVE